MVSFSGTARPSPARRGFLRFHGWIWGITFLAILLSPSTLAARDLILSSIESVPAQLDTVRSDSIVILEFTASQRLDRAHRATQFIWDFKASEGGGALADSVVAGSYQRLLASKRDSTARLKNFTYLLKDQPQVSLFRQREFYPMFLKTSAQSVQWSSHLDSAGTNIIIRETLGDVDVKIPLKIPLEEYIRLSLADAQRHSIADYAHQYAMKEGKQDDFGALIGAVTKIEIPVPANPVLSIFGKPSISLNISGDVNIKAAYRSVTEDEATISALGNTRNEPDFAQVVRLNVDGLIGDKLAIRANWDTQTQFEYENRLSLVYTGYDDEIVKKVEAGNVSLSTPSSFIGSSQALFGIKTTMQFGPLTLTALASQKKGQVQELTVSGGSSEKTFEIHAYDFSTKHYFIDTLYRGQYSNYYDRPTPQSNPRLAVSEIEVYKSRIQTNALNGIERPGIAFINLPAAPTSGRYDDGMRDSTARSGEIELGNFYRLDPSEYTIEKPTGILTLNSDVQDGEIIAVAYRTNSNIVYGEFAARGDTSKNNVILKLVKPANQIPTNQQAWRLLVKNRYPLGGYGLKKEKFKLDIHYNIPGQDPVDQLYGQNLLQVFHLDKINDAGEPKPDNNFDFIPGITIDQEHGELIFPTLEPFRDAFKLWWDSLKVSSDVPPDSLAYPDIYDNTLSIARQNVVRDRFTIIGTFSSTTSSKYSIGFNVVENSVQVLLDGVPLQAGSDYSVDYNLGEVTIRRDDALVPGKNLQIKYESNDLFQMASKTLTALRGDFRLGQNSNLGFTIMNYNQQTLSDKVRLGEEPMSNTIMGIDGSMKQDLGFLTDALNFLPSYYSKEISQFSIKGEAAYMSPDPNTKKSTIQSDDGNGIAYIDDFEGLKQTIPLGIGYTMWKYASPPKYLIGRDPFTALDSIIDLSNVMPEKLKVHYKANTYWYNKLPADVNVNDIWPERKVAIDQQNITSLSIHYDPTQRGVYNYYPDSIALDPRRNWGGLMKVISSASTNLVDENINYIEFWMQVTGGDTTELNRAKLLIDLGKISEDVIPNGILNTEDGIRGNKVPNDRVNPDEDVGLDSLNDAEERARWPALGDDPSLDDYAYSTGNYEKVNGIEGNKNTESGLFPDTEDLNRNGNLDLIDSYFEYEIPLDTTGGVNGSQGKKNPFIVGGGLTKSNWYQFRIPLVSATRSIGSPSLETVQSVRIWFTGTAKPIEVRIVDLSLVGSQWRVVQNNDTTTTVDTTIAISTVSIEETPGYVSPPGVAREQDKTHPNENVLANEQSLVLKVRGLNRGDSRRIQKVFSYKPLDIFSYRTLKMFVRSDPNFNRDTTHTDAVFFFRFGLDSLNYYEYSAPLRWNDRADASGQWLTNNVEINFSELTALKQKRDSTKLYSEPLAHGPPGSRYTIIGQPTLTQIKELSLGVRNSDSSRVSPISGDVWVDELRVINPDATPGWAGRLEATLKLADLATTTVAISRIDPYFHTLDQRFGNRNMNTNWSIDTKVSLDRFLPTTWTGSTIAVSYTHTEMLSNPLYLPGTDMLVEEAARRSAERVQQDSTRSAGDAKAVHDSIVNASQVMTLNDTWAVPTVRINLPSKAWYIQYLLNRFTFGFTYTKSSERSPVEQNLQRWSWSTTAGYGLTFAPDNYYSPFQTMFDRVPVLDFIKGWRLFYTPQTFNTSMSAQRGRINELQRGPYGLKPVQRTFTANRSLSFLWKFSEGGIVNPSMDYSINVMSSLVHLETDTAGNQRRFSQILGDIFHAKGLINFGIDNGYDQRVNFVFRPRIPPLFKLDKSLEVTGNYSSGYRWTYNFQQAELGKSAGFATSLSLNMTFKLKQFTDPWFPPGDVEKKDSLKPAVDYAQILRTAIKVPFLEFETVNITFSQTNSAQNSGVRGGTGFGNFWEKAPFFQESDPELGPSRLYQLGLISSPSNRLTNFRIRPSFPFFTFDVDTGLRAGAPGGLGNLIDNFNQSNRVTFTTSRELWKGARIDLNWNVSWSYNRNVSLISDSLGHTQISNTTTTGDVERSYFTLPPFFLFKPFKSGIDQVGRLYEQMQVDTTQVGEKLAKAFEQGFETLPFLSKLLGNLMPRLNYSLKWDGLEKLPFVKDVATRVSFDHAYKSTFNRQWTGGDIGMTTQSERISYGFDPLANISIVFKEFWKGNMNGSIKYSTQTTYDLNIATANIIEGSTRDVSVTLGYARHGFELPLFGLSLSNDIDVSLSYTYNSNSRKTYTPDQLTSSGTPFEGSTRTVLEPRIKYVLSMRVTASMYFRRTTIVPDQGSRTIGQKTSEFGFDIKLSIGQ